jgi:NAD dependent epimerase/dehydratase
MDWKGRRVLITGAGGFIASHLTERLVAEGARVRAFVRYNSRGDVGLLRLLPPELYTQLEIVLGDLRDGEALRAAVKGIDTIFHLGALIAIPYSYIHPREVVETNVMGTLNLLMAARDSNAVRRIVHTSTSEVYGTAQYVPIDERHPLQGQSPYSASKIGADKLAESFHRSFGLPILTLRPFNTYGPRQSARAVIPTIITQALTRDEIRLGSLEPSRDFTFVSDTVEGFLCAAGEEDVLGQEMNLGTRTAVSVGELADVILTLVGKDARIVSESRRFRPKDSEVFLLHASNEKAYRLIGWRPQISLEEGLRLTVQWIASHLDLYQPDQYMV